jgi:hypothetical protein
LWLLNGAHPKPIQQAARIVGMKISRAWLPLAIFGIAAVLFEPAFAQSNNSASSDPCAAQTSTDVPQVSISNGQIHALIDLPDPQKGYYRSTRFDWSGVIPCLSYDGHTYFSPWRPTHDPLGHDSISGPVEEFHSSDGALGYADAKAGGLFVKPGVGVLRRIDDAPYKFQTFYPIVDNGKWTYRSKKNEIAMTQHLSSPLGYAYIYTKTVELEKGQPVMLLHHHMENTGTKTIETDVYDHDFYRLDNVPTGPDMVIHFAFSPKTTRPLTNGGQIQGHDLVYQSELQERQSVQSQITGYSDNVADYDFTVKNVKTGVGVEQTSDSPIANMVFWSVPATIAPEAYIHLHIPPGGAQDWTIRYRFFDK